MNQAEPTVTLAGVRLDRYRHVCAFFDNADQEHQVLDPFVREGLERGEKAFHIVDPALRADYWRRLQAANIDVAAAEKTGHFELRTWDEAYLRGGRFVQDAMLALIEEVLDRGPHEGFPLTRMVGHMEWALEDRRGTDDLVEYETRLNFLLPRYKDPVI